MQPIYARQCSPNSVRRVRPNPDGISGRDERVLPPEYACDATCLLLASPATSTTAATHSNQPSQLLSGAPAAAPLLSVSHNSAQPQHIFHGHTRTHASDSFACPSCNHSSIPQFHVEHTPTADSAKGCQKVRFASFKTI